MADGVVPEQSSQGSEVRGWDKPPGGPHVGWSAFLCGRKIVESHGRSALAIERQMTDRRHTIEFLGQR